MAETNTSHPWVAGKLRFRGAELEAAARAAEASYAARQEACGYFRGPAADALLADELVVMDNLADRYHALDPESYPRRGDKYFLLDARKFQRAVEAGPGEGRPVKVLWHSHLDVGAYFSETDAAAATMGGDAPAHPLAYLVTSVRAGKVDGHKLFVWSSGVFVESAFEVVDESPAR